jgi:hypothetical protein
MQLRRARDRYYTPAEATAALPLLRATADAARASSRARQDLLDQLRTDRTLRPEQRRAAAQKAEHHRQEVHQRLDEISELGADVIALVPMRLAFPALRDGHEVVLDWREGDPRVAHWQVRAPASPRRHRIQDPDSPRWMWSH